MHSLDNVIWQALTTRQSMFAESFGQARRFVPEVSPLCGFPEPTEQGYQSLAELAGAAGSASVFLDEPYQPQRGWDHVGGAPLLQMVCSNCNVALTPQPDHPEFVELKREHVPEMVELATLTKPGPF